MPIAALAQLAHGLRDEWQALRWRDARVRDAMRPVLSVLLAVLAAHALGLHDAWWAAITAFMVMQADFGASAWRGVLRVVGTLAGAGLGLLLGPLAAPQPVAFVLLMTLAAWAGLFAALRWRHSYAWVLALVSFVMVMCEARSAHADLQAFVRERVANIVLGTLACVVVAGLTDRRVRGALLRQPAADTPAGARWAGIPSGRLAQTPADSRTVARHALQGAVVVAMLAIVICRVHLPAFAQALVTTLAVLVVPLEAGVADTQGRVAERMLQRIAGCLAAGAIAFALLPPLEGHPFACLLVLCAGIWLGAYLQRGPASVRYMATQFSVAFLMVFVQDSGWQVEAGPAFERLAGIVAGVLALALVMQVSRRLRSLR